MMPSIHASLVHHRESKQQALVGLASSSNQLVTNVNMDTHEEIQFEQIQDMLYSFFCDDLLHEQDIDIDKPHGRITLHGLLGWRPLGGFRWPQF